MFAFVQHLSLARKLALLGAMAATMCAIPSALLIRNMESTAAATQAELAGLEPSRALLKLMRLTQQHRGLSASVLGGRAEVEPERAAKQAEVDQALRSFDTMLKAGTRDAHITTDWQRAQTEWQALGPAVAGKTADGAQSYLRHTALVAMQIELHERLADHFGLTLDPDAPTYHLVIGTLQLMPRLTEVLGQARARGVLILAKKEGAADDKAAVSALAERAQMALRDLDISLSKSFDASASIKTALSGTVQKASAEVATVMKLARDQIVLAKELNYPADDYRKATTAAIDSMYDLSAQASKSLESELHGRLAQTRRDEAAMAAGIVAVALLGLWLGLATFRSLSRSMVETQAAARRIAAGDLSGEIVVGSGDEVGQMMAAMRDMQTSLTQVVGTVRRNAENVATGSAQIAQGNLDLSNRTEQQAGALQQTAATMDELGTTVRHNTDNAKVASQLATSASAVAERGGAVVGQVVETMRDINDSSKRIADIISVIDGIAFQTNILALNAAVEAARAGEQGRGFAVVAGEVRSLAQRSADAAKEIKGLISASVERVDHGTTLVSQAGETMTEIVASIKRVSDIVGEISAASIEQSAGVGHVGQAMASMDAATQQNAALVEESAAAAQSLRHQADQLVQAVAVFRL